MQISFTQPAAERLAEAFPQGDARRLKLVYDTEGCGCAVNGVPALQLIGEPEPGAPKATGSQPFEVYYDPQHEIFFEDELKVDFNAERNRYVLKSDNQTYTNNLRVLPGPY